MALHLEIVTPERKVFSDQVDNVYLPGTDGEMGVLTGHAALVSAMDAGELRYSKGGQVTELAVGHGFAEVTQEKVTILTDVAFEEDQIDESKVEAAMKRAEEALENIDPKEAEEMASQQKVIASAMAQLALKKKRRG